MSTHISIPFIILTVIYHSLTFTHAWWDITHMTIGKIAQLNMDPKDVEKLNAFLEIYEFNYPAMSNIVNATTFPDHVRCQAATKLDCKGLEFSDATTMFNGFHTAQIPYVDENEEPPVSLYDVRRPVEMPGSSEGIVFFLQSVKTHVDAMAANKCTSEACPVQMGSDFSWNYNLRFYLHMFGDIHMPCHLGSGVSKHFPLGCSFCQGITMGYPTPETYNIPETGKESFHQYMDGIGYTTYGRWPNLSDEEITGYAEAYIEEFPKSQFEEDLKKDPWDFKEIAYESFAVHNKIYDEIDFFNFQPKKIENGQEVDNFLFLTEEQDTNFKKILKERVALTGYRLAQGLTDYAQAMPDIDADLFSSINKLDQTGDNQTGDNQTGDNQTGDDETGGNNDMVVIILAVLMVVFFITTVVSFVKFYQLSNKNKSVGI